MIILLETTEHCARFRRVKIMADTQSLCRARVLRVNVPLKTCWKPRRREKFMRGVLERLRGEGVTKVITIPSFEYQNLLTECGIATPGTIVLRRALAPLRVGRVLDGNFRTDACITAAVYAARPSRECDAVVMRLIKRCRTVAVDFQRGGGDYAARMYAACGVPLLQTAQAFADASLLVLLDRPPDFSPPLGAVVVDCAAGAKLRVPEWFDPQIFDAGQLAAELYGAGVLKVRDVEILDPENPISGGFLVVSV